MLTFFPHPYPDELMYSILARYHKRSPNTSSSQTIKELFGVQYAYGNIFFATGLDLLVSRLPIGTNYTTDGFIYNNTLFPLFAPFLSPEKHNLLLKIMKEKPSKQNKNTLSGHVKFLRFCPECNLEDYKEYGELYWHRSHQISGVSVCTKHNAIIRNSSVPVSQLNSLGYIVATKDNCIVKDDQINTSHFEQLYKIASEIDWLLSNKTTPKAHNWYKDNFRALLKHFGYTSSRRVIKEKFCNDFIGFYGESVLKLLDSSVDIEKREEWVNMILRKSEKNEPPIRYILISNFFNKSVRDLIENKLEFHYFGNGPWPCLNHVADHYLQFVVRSVNEAVSYETKQPIGTFECLCGFKYTRIGPDINEADKFRIDYVTDYGYVFEEKVRVLKYDLKLSNKQISMFLKIKLVALNRILSKNSTIVREKHRNKWIETKRKFPLYSKSQLSVKISKTANWLYKYDKEWLDKNSPPVKKKSWSKNGNVNWQLRDEEYLDKIKKEVIREQNSIDKPIRISLRRLVLLTKIGYSKLNLNKLPKTSNYLKEVIETAEKYQIRKARWAANALFNKGRKITTSNIRTKSNLTHHISKVVIEEIELLVKYYNNLNVDRMNVIEMVAVSQEE